MYIGAAVIMVIPDFLVIPAFLVAPAFRLFWLFSSSSFPVVLTFLVVIVLKNKLKKKTGTHSAYLLRSLVTN
jgi:hypothetical protein